LFVSVFVVALSVVSKFVIVVSFGLLLSALSAKSRKSHPTGDAFVLVSVGKIVAIIFSLYYKLSPFSVQVS